MNESLEELIFLERCECYKHSISNTQQLRIGIVRILSVIGLLEGFAFFLMSLWAWAIVPAMVGILPLAGGIGMWIYGNRLFARSILGKKKE